MKTGDEWAEIKRVKLHRGTHVRDGYSVIDVRRYGKRLELVEFGVFKNYERLADGFSTAESAIAWINEKALSGEPKA